MTTKKNQEVENPEQVIESALGKTEQFLVNNGRSLLTILGVLVVAAGIFFAYKYLYAAPRQEKAASAMFAAQDLFAIDSFALALNGDATFDGFLRVIESYGSTPSGNLAKHYAGQCYLRMGEYDNAIKYFGMYSDVKGIPAQIINALNAGFTGDAYVQSGDLAKGLSFYEKAYGVSGNDVTTPYYMRKAGIIRQQLGNFAGALELYKRVKNEYPLSGDAGEMDKYIAEVEQVM